jgi:hypothetical protein
MSKVKLTVSEKAAGGCGLAVLLMFPLVWFLFAECIEWALQVWFGKDVAWYWDYLLALLLSESMPLIIVATFFATLCVDQLPVS